MLVVAGIDGTTTSQTERFSIDVTTGEIYVDPKTLDYEIERNHILCINASTSRTDSSFRSQQWKVLIVVTDRNDHDITFTDSTVNVGEFLYVQLLWLSLNLIASIAKLIYFA